MTKKKAGKAKDQYYNLRKKSYLNVNPSFFIIFLIKSFRLS